MVHFDFVVDDIDAENIMSCLMDAENDTLEKIADLKVDIGVSNTQRASMIKWYEGRREYLKELQGKMKNTRVES
jgi:hypothetical protein